MREKGKGFGIWVDFGKYLGGTEDFWGTEVYAGIWGFTGKVWGDPGGYWGLLSPYPYPPYGPNTSHTLCGGDLAPTTGMGEGLG